MSVLKNPIVLAFLACAIAYCITAYFYKESTDTNKKKTKKQKPGTEYSMFSETPIIVAAIAGLMVYYIASSYFAEDIKNNSNSATPSNTIDNKKLPDSSKQEGIIDINSTNNSNNGNEYSGIAPIISNTLNDANSVKLPSTNNSMANLTKQKIEISRNAIPNINTEDPTRSYNLISSGINIPRADLKLPPVMIDYTT